MKKTVTTIPQMLMLNFINIGLVIFWAVDGAFMTPFLTKKGYSPYNLTEAKAGYILAIGQFMVCIGFIIGLLSDGTRTKFGKRLPYMFSGVVLAAAGYALLPHTQSLAMLITVQTAVYFFIVWGSIPYYSLIPDATPEQKLGTCNAFFSIFGAVGTIVGYLVIGGFLANPVTHPTMFRFLPFYATGAMLILTMLPTIFITREDTNYSAQPAPEPILRRAADIVHELPKYMDLVFFMCLNFFMWMGLQGFVKYFTVFMDKDIGVPAAQASMLMGFLPGLAILCAVPLGILADKISRKGMLLAGLAACTVVMALGFFVIHDKVSATIVIAFAAIAVVDVFLLMAAIAPTLMPKDKVGFYMGVLSATTGLGGVAGVILSGFLSTALVQGMHCRVIFLVGAACLALSTLFLLKVKIRNASELASETQATA